MPDARDAGERVEALLAELRTRSGPEAAGVAEELVTCLVRLYGAGLETIVRTIGDDQRLKALLVADPLVESLLLVHDLHPLDTSARIKRALGRLGPGTEFLGRRRGRAEAARRQRAQQFLDPRARAADPRRHRQLDRVTADIGECTFWSVLPLPRYMCTPQGRHGSKLRTARMMSMPLNWSGGFSSKIGVFCTASS